MLALIDLQMMMDDPETGSLIRVILLVFIGFALLYLFSFAVSRFLASRQTPHFSQLARKFIFYVGSIIILLSVMLELGFDLRGLLATAGIATVAIGFAAQTSLSNLISGLFLIGEQPFSIGDLVRVNDTLGVVESIDLLSIKLRTLDNLYVRIPNESMIKNQVTTVTKYPIRRMDLDIGVAYREDVGRVMEVLKDLATKNPFVLDDPAPLILFNHFGDSALQFRFGLWFEKSNYLVLRNSIMKDIKERFDEEDIEIPFPHMTLYSGSETSPFPVQVQNTTSKND
ncbi:mechanosensitive ion channel family protein [Puniceicoccales bacterium CK1056]|uniref:Mechanosensitive ion channel family protein n=2 Tax=Oceanipulchritudo coccoides TaxID=2706888 RepID=A0A6B2M681_9BACT|nr:mechanosensitive ion channel family protein [Oceanipulchritudo coccoides]